MTTLSPTITVVEIQWRSDASGATALPVVQHPTKEGLLKLAQALGRLAARRDMSRAAPSVAGECHTGGGIEDRMEAEAV